MSGAGSGRPADEHVHDIYTIANIITVLRLILVPLFFTVLINGENNGLAFLLFAVAASTDWLDGQIARRTGTVTAIGKAIDPLVDRLLIAFGVIGLYVEERLPLWIPIVLVSRDLFLGYGVWRLETVYHRRLAVSMVGKVTTAASACRFRRPHSRLADRPRVWESSTARAAWVRQRACGPWYLVRVRRGRPVDGLGDRIRISPSEDDRGAQG